jgi:hypothetical protein
MRVPGMDMPRIRMPVGMVFMGAIVVHAIKLTRRRFAAKKIVLGR